MFDPTLNGVMTQVEAGKIVLPAMQRPFVWKEDRITRLIDSLLRGFPLGMTLLWKTATMQRFRRFQKDVQADAGITLDYESDTSTERYLVLDGQQRLTSLFVAIAGTYDGRRLFLDVLSGERGTRIRETSTGTAASSPRRRLLTSMPGRVPQPTRRSPWRAPTL